MRPLVIRGHELTVVDRGSGIRTVTYADAAMGAERIMSGRTTFPPGARIAHHTHSREELVVVLFGHATLEVEGELHSLDPFDASFIPPDVVHRFANDSSEALEILWMYGGADMIRTIVPAPG